MTKAFEIMREWDLEAGIQSRSDEHLQMDVAGSVRGNFDEWVEALESGDPAAIVEGRIMWGLEPL